MIYTITITDETGHDHVESRMRMNHPPTPDNLALLTAKLAMSLDPKAIHVAAVYLEREKRA